MVGAGWKTSHVLVLWYPNLKNYRTRCSKTNDISYSLSFLNKAKRRKPWNEKRSENQRSRTVNWPVRCFGPTGTKREDCSSRQPPRARCSRCRPQTAATGCWRFGRPVVLLMLATEKTRTVAVRFLLFGDDGRSVLNRVDGCREGIPNGQCSPVACRSRPRRQRLCVRRSLSKQRDLPWMFDGQTTALTWSGVLGQSPVWRLEVSGSKASHPTTPPFNEPVVVWSILVANHHFETRLAKTMIWWTFGLDRIKEPDE